MDITKIAKFIDKEIEPLFHIKESGKQSFKVVQQMTKTLPKYKKELFEALSTKLPIAITKELDANGIIYNRYEGDINYVTHIKPIESKIDYFVSTLLKEEKKTKEVSRSDALKLKNYVYQSVINHINTHE